MEGLFHASFHMPNLFLKTAMTPGASSPKNLTEYADKSVIVLGIPNGGVAVALGVALALNAELDLIISRKIPSP